MTKVVQFVMDMGVYITGLIQSLEECDSFMNGHENIVLSEKEIMKDYKKLKGVVELSDLGLYRRLEFWIDLNRYLENRYADLKGGIVNIQYVSRFYVCILPFLTKTFSRIILSFWGSDLLQQKKSELLLLGFLVRKSHSITFPTSEMARTFENKMGKRYGDRIRIVRFGNYFMNLIDNVSRKSIDGFINKFGIDNGRKTVVVGYNRCREQQHLKALQSIVDAEVPREDVFIIIPWTYGEADEEYKEQVECIIRGFYDYVFLQERLSDSEVAAFRMISDILIVVEETDALNATMLETMYSNGEVMVGSWLPYGDIYKRGIKMKKVATITEVGNSLIEMLDYGMTATDKLNNKMLIKELYSWSNNINDWITLYS